MKARLGRLMLELWSAHPVKLDHVAFRFTAGVDPPLAFDQDGLLEHAHSDGARHVDDSVDPRGLRGGALIAASAVERLNGGDDRHGEQATRAEVSPRASEECGPP